MTAITFDDSRWPLIVLSYPDVFSEAEWRNLMDRIIATVERGEDFGMVNDVRTGAAPNAAQRKQIANTTVTTTARSRGIGRAPR